MVIRGNNLLDQPPDSTSNIQSNVDDGLSGDTHQSTLKHNIDDDLIPPTQDTRDTPTKKSTDYVSGELTSLNISF
jgi:hypothetical protein